MIAMYLRCLTGDRSRAWLDWLPWAEYCYNTAHHSSLRTSPFKVVYGLDPPALLPYTAGSSQTGAADRLLQDRDTFLEEVRERLLQGQVYAKKYYDANHRALEFAVGDWVWLRLLHRPAQSLVPGPRGKLRPRFAGPFRVLERVGDVAYRLELPADARIHDLFHVGVLKPYRRPRRLRFLPCAMAGSCSNRRGRSVLNYVWGVWHVLIQWLNLPDSEATWEPLEDFRSRFPSFQLEDELFVEGGRVVMVGRTYARRSRAAG